MGSSDIQDGTTDTVVSKAVDLDLCSRERRDLATVLTVAGVAESDETSDLVLDGSGELLGETVDDGGALRVAASDDDAVGALCVGQVEEAQTLVDSGGRGAGRGEVIEEAGGVGSADALAGYVGGAVAALEAVADLRSAAVALGTG